MTVFIILSLFSLASPLSAAFVVGKHAGIRRHNLALFLTVGLGGWMLAKIPKGILILPIFIIKGVPADGSKSVGGVAAD
jgi:hypothetical protein